MTALLLSLLLAPTADPAGVLPVGADGKPLNLDFEAGTLKDWTADGAAFQGQPIKGDTVSPRRGDMKSNHQGQFWIGGYEKHADKPTGTLTSVPFQVTHPWASFLIGGGPHPKDTFVELIDVAAKKPFFTASNTEESETLRRVAVDLAKVRGKEIQIRLVDKHTGHWGHLNFDDFRFHDAKPAVPAAPAPVALDVYPYAGQDPKDAAKNMTVPPGFRVSLFAGEPDLHQPIAMCFDDRGRLWVVEAYCYPKRKPFDGPLLPADRRKEGDKILIFEDVDGDGTFDTKTTFLEGLNLASGIEYGFGGVWVGAAPYLLFVPILPGDKAGEPKVLLDGWGYQDTHETLNSFIWGPDGYLYGCHGVFTHSRVGKPGTPDKDRTPINAGVWRYHPTRHTFEVFAHGTSNPWGIDFNQHGDLFAEACVIPHLWHLVQGGRYFRQAGQHFNPYTYDDIKTIAKHRHYVGATPHGGNNKSDSAGGGHAHSGLVCYQGGTWPKEYHGKLFMGNLHGHRINVDVVTPKGSGYEGDRQPDFLLANDRTVIIVGMQVGPDGNLYFGDWSDKQVCHRPEPEIWDRTNGRIFKVSHDGTKPVKGLDLQKCTDAELVQYQLHDNEWYVRHARRILQERRAKNFDGDDTRYLSTLVALRKMMTGHADASRRLRAYWCWDAVYGNHEDVHDHIRERIHEDKDEHVRAWLTRFVFDRLEACFQVNLTWEPDIMVRFAEKDPSPVVRRAVASGLQKVGHQGVFDNKQKLPPRTKDVILVALLSREVPADDPNLVYLLWYALEPLAELDAPAAMKYVVEGKVPQLLPWLARRIASVGKPESFALLVKQLDHTKTADQQLAILHGLADGMKGRRDVKAPAEWAAAYAKLAMSESADVRSAALAVGVKFGDEAAFTSLRDVLMDTKADAAKRNAALAALVEAKDAKLPSFLRLLLADKAVRAGCIRALAAYPEDAKTPTMLLAIYPTATADEKRDVVGTLTSRVSYGRALLDAVGKKDVPAADIPAEAIRQLNNLNDSQLSLQILGLWGSVRDTPADRKKLIADWKKKLTLTDSPDLTAGRAVFGKVCAQCHTLYGVGGKVGPEITGSNRANLDYLLENVFDPSAVIPKEYAATKLDLADGRVVTGIVKEETKAALTVVTDRETLTIPVGDVTGRKASAESMMPNDLTKQLTEREVRNLIAYLRHPQQVPMKATADNAKEFFNGKDILAWDGDKDVWAVENGEIVGKTRTGLKKNTFLKGPLEVGDFKLTVKVKLTPNTENSGIQFRSANIDGGEMRGPQADMGKGWWGKLYEESARGMLVKDGGEKFVKENDWNEYVIEAVGPAVKVWLNGEKVVDYTDDKLAKTGLIAFQVHSGGPMEVRFKDIKLEVK